MRRWDVLVSMIQAENFNHFVEVGTKEGRTTSFVLEHCPMVKVIGIDPWSQMVKDDDVNGGETYEQWDFKEIEREFWKCVEPWKSRLTFMRRTSRDSASKVEDGSQDIIFIDAAHDYDSVLEDISLWTPKIREGGILAGHDFQHSFPSVMEAVADSFNLMFVEIMPDSVWWIRC